MECTLQNLKQKSLTKAEERATSAEDCRRVSVNVSVQEYSVQCKGYNLIGVTTVEASETRGTTALVYCLISSSLYTGTVQGWWSTPPTGLTVSRGEVHPNWFDGQQGCSQLSTVRYFIAHVGKKILYNLFLTACDVLLQQSLKSIPAYCLHYK
jgi:hypothetical protein